MTESRNHAVASCIIVGHISKPASVNRNDAIVSPSKLAGSIVPSAKYPTNVSMRTSSSASVPAMLKAASIRIFTIACPLRARRAAKPSIRKLSGLGARMLVGRGWLRSKAHATSEKARGLLSLLALGNSFLRLRSAINAIRFVFSCANSWQLVVRSAQIKSGSQKIVAGN
jgi:hypothetical protein